MANKYFSKKFVNSKYPSNVVQTEGSLVMVGNLSPEKKEPEDVIITVQSNISAGETSIPVKSNKDIKLQQGKVLYFFGDNPVNVSETCQLKANTQKSIKIDPSEYGLANGEFTKTWELFRVLSPQSLPLQSDSDSVDRKDYNQGLQSQKVKTSINLNSDIEIINRYDDEAYWRFIHPAMKGSKMIFGAIVTGSEIAWGPVNVSQLEDKNELEDISRISVSFDFQFPYSRVGFCQYLDIYEKISKTLLVRRLGISSGVCNIFDFLATPKSDVWIWIDSSGSMSSYIDEISNGLKSSKIILEKYLYKDNETRTHLINDGSESKERWLDWAYQSIQESASEKEVFYLGFINESQNEDYFDNGTNYQTDYDNFTTEYPNASLFLGEITEAPGWSGDDFITHLEKTHNGTDPYDTNGPGLYDFSFRQYRNLDENDASKILFYAAIIMDIVTYNSFDEIRKFFEV